MFALIKARKFGDVGSKSRSPGQILKKKKKKKNGIRSTGHIFCPILLNLGQNVCLDEISDKLKSGHVGSTTRSLSQI